MALAQPALRQFGIQRLQNLRFRGGSLLGSAIGSAIGIGYGLVKDYEFGFPWSPTLEPNRPHRPFPGVRDGSIYAPKATSYQQQQALRASYRSNYRGRRHSKRHNCSKCCCSCNC